MSIEVESVIAAGDVIIDEVTIITSNGFAQDIKPQVMGLEIYEDLFGSFITGKIFVQDAQELINLLPLIGQEIVKISVKTPSLDDADGFTGEFYIYKLDDRMKMKERELMYVLHFISKEAIIDMNKKISKAYSGKISDIATKVLSEEDALESTKFLNIEPTKNSTKYVSNFWSPLKNLQYLADNAVNESDSPTYVFYESKFGLNFTSLDRLYTGTPLYQRFIWDNYSMDMLPGGGSRRDISADYQRVLEFNMTESFNYMDRLKTGMYGSEIIYFDMLTKQYVHNNYVPAFSESNHLNEYPLWANNPIVRPKSLVFHENKMYNTHDGYDDTSNVKFVQKRAALMSQAEAYKVTISVHGRTDYTVGQKIYLEVPKNTQIKKDDEAEDKIMSGVYLISAICHNITRKSHQCIIELIKDSYMVDINATK